MSQFELDIIEVGPLAVNCYLLACPQTGEIAVVDPGTDTNRIIQRIERKNWKPIMVLNTHGHIDHVAGNADIAEHFGIEVVMHRDDLFLLDAPDLFGLAGLLNARRSPQPSRLLTDREEIRIGEQVLTVLHTPGHTPGSCCFLNGDTVFAGSVGRTDLPGGDYQRLISSITGTLCPLPDGTRLFPGHGPTTSMGEERVSNPFFSCQ